eukprot:s237_g31.t1
MAGFRDLQDVAAERWHRDIRPTCKGRTRRDFLFISPELQQLLHQVDVRDDIWADHSVLQGTFISPRQLAPQWIWPAPASFPWPAQFGLHYCKWPVDSDDPTGDYAALWEHIEADACSHVPFPVQKSAFGRGRVIHPKPCKVSQLSPIKLGRQGEFQPEFFGTSTRHAQWVRQTRRLQHFARLAASDKSVSVQLAEVWGSILRAKGFFPDFPTWWLDAGFRTDRAPVICPQWPPEAAVAQALCDSVAMATRDLESKLKSQSKQYAKMRRENNPNLVFQDLRATTVPGVDILLQPIRAKVAEVDQVESKLVLDQSIELPSDEVLQCKGLPVPVIHHDSDCLWVQSVDGFAVDDVVTSACKVGFIDDLAREFIQAWKSRWMRHLRVPPERWSPIIQFGKQFLPPGRYDWSSLDVPALQHALAAKKPHTSAGMDGVTLLDLKSMTPQLLQCFCDLFTLAASKGTWPNQVVAGRVTCLAKTHMPLSASDFRPITVFGLLYRSWSSHHAKQAIRVLDAVLPDAMYGSRPGCYASQVWARILWTIEQSFLDEVPLSGLVADINKALNMLPRDVVFELAGHIGIPTRVLLGWAGALVQMERRFVLRGSLTDPVCSVTGFPEGCALSCVAMLVVDFLFHKWFEIQYPLAAPVSYVDDWQLICCSPAFVDGAKRCLDRFVDAMTFSLIAKRPIRGP